MLYTLHSQRETLHPFCATRHKTHRILTCSPQSSHIVLCRNQGPSSEITGDFLITGTASHPAGPHAAPLVHSDTNRRSCPVQNKGRDSRLSLCPDTGTRHKHLRLMPLFVESCGDILTIQNNPQDSRFLICHLYTSTQIFLLTYIAVMHVFSIF